MHSSTLFIFKQKPLQRNANEVNNILNSESRCDLGVRRVLAYLKRQAHQKKAVQEKYNRKRNDTRRRKAAIIKNI